MNTEYIFIKEAPIPTNCPECYTTDGLQLSFYQKRKVSKLFRRTTNIIEKKLNCKTCETRIYPGRWTDDIERMYEYNKKTIVPNKSKFELTIVSYLLITLVVLLIVAGISYGYAS